MIPVLCCDRNGSGILGIVELTVKSFGIPNKVVDRVVEPSVARPLLRGRKVSNSIGVYAEAQFDSGETGKDLSMPGICPQFEEKGENKRSMT